MSLQLKNKNIVVIGGTTGIGLSAAKAFIEQGAKVIVAGEMKKMLSRQRLNWEKMGKPSKRMQGRSKQQ
jgi:Short-chain dehydrogenase involved in D-alanine esterification of lipoteichoic acid and wall teichoic acid (D-alanine transfer protein)